MKPVKVEGEVLLRPGEKPGHFLLAERIAVWRGRDVCILDAGTEINGESIPWILQRLLKKFHPETFLASIVHDALVGEWGDPVAVIKSDSHEPITWEEAAEWMIDLIEYSGGKPWKRFVFKRGVLVWSKLLRVFRPRKVKNGK